MSTYTLDQFRDILILLDGKPADRPPFWDCDPDENTFTIELGEGVVVSLFRREAEDESIMPGAVLHQNGELEATLEAEGPGEDWELLNRLYESASAAVDEEGLARGPSDHSPHRFDPTKRPKPRHDELTDGDSPLDATNDG